MKRTQQSKDRIFGAQICAVVLVTIFGGLFLTLLCLGIITVPAWK